MAHKTACNFLLIDDSAISDRKRITLFCVSCCFTLKIAFKKKKTENNKINF